MTMKIQCGIWLDTKQARLVFKKGESKEVTTIESEVENKVHHWDDANTGTFKSSFGHHQNDEKKYEERKKHQLADYMDSVVTRLKNVDEIYILGPAEAKNLLEDHLHRHSDFRYKLLVMETADKMTENQLIAKVDDFFDH